MSNFLKNILQKLALIATVFKKKGSGNFMDLKDENPKYDHPNKKSKVNGFKQSKKRFKYSRQRNNNPSTPINPLNRHSEYGFAIRRMRKLNRKPSSCTAYRLPQFLTA